MTRPPRELYPFTDRWMEMAPDYPGFGLSQAAPGYAFTPREHSQVIEKLALALDLRDLTLMVQDWGGPIGLGFAGRHPERVRALVIGNTWAWPVNGDPHFDRFARVMGGPVGRFAIRERERRRFEQRFADHRTVILETARHYIQEDEPARIADEIRAFLK